MPTLPTNRTTSSTAAEHVDDHNTLHTLNNQLGTFTQATTAPATPADGDLWLDTDEPGTQSGTSVLTQNPQTGTTYTLVLADDGKLVELSNAAAITLTVPPNSSVAFPIGCQIHGAQTGAGQVTVAPGSGVTINGTPGLKARAQWSAFTLIKRATDTWLLIGDLAA